jgi:hypothetical protein
MDGEEEMSVTLVIPVHRVLVSLGWRERKLRRRPDICEILRRKMFAKRALRQLSMISVFFQPASNLCFPYSIYTGPQG